MTSNATTKEALRRMIDQLQGGEVQAAERFVEYLLFARQHPAVRALLTAPVDDEPETAEESAAMREAEEDIAHGRIVADEDFVL